jgi:Ca2+-binding EF-hand superfamily protein
MPVRICRLGRAAAGLLLIAAATGAGAQDASAPVPTPPPAQNTASGDVPRAAFIATMDAEFRRRDGDGDGIVARAELQSFEAAEALTAARLANRDLFLRLDTDRNGALSLEEFAVLVGTPAAPDIAPQMARLDGNGDQRITLIEYRAATLSAFDRLDTDLDGIVTTAEMQAGQIAPAGR